MEKHENDHVVLPVQGKNDQKRGKSWLWQEPGDWRTFLLAIFIYASWVVLVFFDTGLPLWLTFIVLTPLVTLHSSLQHECLHGHPFRSEALSDALTYVSLGVLVPYGRFKQTHLKHHQNTNLCDPYEDPESWYQDRHIWEQRSRLLKMIFNFNNMLFGRLVIGPALGLAGFYRNDLRLILAGDRQILRSWLDHGLVMAGLFALIANYGQVSIWFYLVVCYWAMSLLLVRTYLEHQAHERVRERSVIIESNGPFSLLFLNNNLHAVHHAYPKIAWYRLPKFFRRNRDRFLKLNGGYQYQSYGEIFRRFLFKQKEPVYYPIAKKSQSRKINSSKD